MKQISKIRSKKPRESGKGTANPLVSLAKADFEEITRKMKLTIDPWISTNNCALWQLQLFNRLLDLLVLEGVLLDLQDLVVVAIAVHIGAEADIALNAPRAEVHNSLVESVLSRIFKGVSTNQGT